MPALGDEFRAAREARHLTLSDVSEQVHIRSTYLESIEHEDWSAIAAPVYVKGFIRTYARFLGLDQEDAVRRYVALVAEGATPSGPQPRPMSNVAQRNRAPSPLLWIGGLVALALVGFVGWSYYQYRGQTGANAPVAATTLAPGPAAPATPATRPPSLSRTVLPAGKASPPRNASAAPKASAAPHASAAPDASAKPHASAKPNASASPNASTHPAASPSGRPNSAASGAADGKQTNASHTLTLEAKSDAWTRVTVDGTAQFEGTLKAGTQKVFHGGSIALHTGNAGGLSVVANGRNVGTLGAPGDVVDRTFDLTKE